MARLAEPNIRLKLLVDMKSRTVFFAAAGKDFVDFLFGLLELPLGSVLGLARSTGNTGTGSWANVYESVKNMDEGYMQSSNTRKPLLEPKIPGYTETKPAALLKQLAYPNHLDCRSRPDGHVKGVATYMVMDDRTVKPVSTISSISLLNSMGIQNFGSLEAKTVEVDVTKGLELLKASFGSTKVLTDVFLPTCAKSSKRERNA